MNKSLFPEFHDRNSKEPSVDHVLTLAAIIREVDGNHSLGAAALAEAILSHPLFYEGVLKVPLGDLASDAVSGLRYIEDSYGRLHGVGWDRVYEKAKRLLPTSTNLRGND